MTRRMMQSPRQKLFWALWVVVAVVGMGACGNTATVQSGETHFLQSCTTRCPDGYECLCGVCTVTCTEDESCEAESDSATCQARQPGCDGGARVCDVACDDNDDCNDVGAGFRCDAGQCRDADYEAPDPPPESECSEDCELVRGFPERAGEGCVEAQATEAAVACTCQSPSGDFACYRRTSDETLWLLPAVEFTDPDAFEACSEAERARMASSCDFAHCPAELRPETTCGLGFTCEVLGCGPAGTLTADGCKRPSCEDSSDCEGGARCSNFELSLLSVFGPPNAEGECGFGGPGGYQSEPQCDIETDLRELCDGTPEVRLFINSQGGFVDSSYPFTNPWGHSFLLVTGRCEYWAGPSADGRLGHGVIEDGEALEALVGWHSLREWSAFEDTESCPDAGTTNIYAPGAAVGCSCGCDAGAPVGLAEALTSGLALADEYANGGGTIDAVRAVTYEFVPEDEQDVPVVREWPLTTPLEDFLAPDPLMLIADSGGRIDEPGDVELLRELALEHRLESGDAPLAVTRELTCSSCMAYGLFIRDDLPEGVALSLAWLLEAR